MMISATIAIPESALIMIDDEYQLFDAAEWFEIV
jgi:hypothetical protein